MNEQRRVSTNRGLWRLAALVWATAIVTTVLFIGFWRFRHVAPHAGWTVGSSALVGILGAALAMRASWQIIRGPRRVAAAAIGLLGLTPIVWFGLFLWQANQNANQRERVGPIWMLPPLALWASSLMEAQARWTLERRSEGKYAMLLDDGSVADPPRLLRELDDYIVRIAAELGQKPSAAKVRWVRGSLLMQEGHSIIDWAITRSDEDRNELTTLDRHETAHAVITCLCSVDQNPPKALVEGWAEYQSSDRERQLRDLDEARRSGTMMSLEELTAPEWYPRSFGAAYWEGGPLVRYLIERFGGPRFFELYDGVREATFPEDCQRILGVSWRQLNDDFHDWVELEAAKLPPVTETKDLPAWQAVELARGVDPQDWRTVVDGYRAASSEREDATPRDAALAFNVESSVVDGQDDRSRQLLAITAGERTWLVGRRLGDGVEAMLLSPERSAERRISNGAAGDVNEVPKSHLPWTALDFWRTYVPVTTPARWLPLGDWPLEDETILIEAITPPETGSSTWKVMYSRSTPVGTARTMLELDADMDWHASAALTEMPSKRRSTEAARLERIGGKVFAAQYKWEDETGATEAMTMRRLSDEEIRLAKDEVERTLEPEWKAPAALKRASTYAVLWPLAGATLWGVDRYLRRRRKGPTVAAAEGERAVIRS